MRLAAVEVTYVCSQGLYITEKCDGCGKLLNQASGLIPCSHRAGSA